MTLAVLAAWLVLENRRLAEVAGRAALAEVLADGAAAAANAGLLVVQRERDAAVGDRTRLEAELLDWQQQHAAMADLVQARAKREEQAAAAAAAAAAALATPMPEGVRLCLAAIHDVLRAEGFSGIRFVDAAGLDDEGLRDAELVEVAPDGLGATIYQAGLVTAALDRATGRMELRMFDGHRVADGERIDLPKDGWAVVFAPVDARAVEARLPFFVKASGVYPAPVGERPIAGLVDPLTRDAWLERLDRLCDLSGGQDRLRVQRFAGLQDGWFLECQLVGTDARNHVTLFASCAKLAVEVDREAGLVSLRLRDGILRRNGVDSKIGAEGHRMLLTNVAPSQALDTMLGMVVSQ